MPRRLAAGAGAGMTATLLTHPLDVVRLRLALPNSPYRGKVLVAVDHHVTLQCRFSHTAVADRTAHAELPAFDLDSVSCTAGIWDAMRSIARTEGFLALYRVNICIFKSALAGASAAHGHA